MVCYHHNDLDGKSAGYLVHKMKPAGVIDYARDYHSTGYNDKFNKHTLKDDVVIVDLSISEETYPMLLETCRTARTVTWIDHHKTSLEVIEKHREELQSIRNLTYFVSSCASGAALTYIFFSLPKRDLQDIRSISDNEYYKIDAEFEFIPDEPISKITAILTRYQKNDESEAAVYTYKYKLPRWLAHVDDYDCWKKNYSSTEAIFLGIESRFTGLTFGDGEENTFFNDFWEELDHNEEEVLELYYTKGSAVKQYLTERYNRELSDSFEWTFKGTKFLCKNGLGNSWNFGEKIKEYAAAILFHYAGSSGKWVYSVYKENPNSDFDCSEFCKQFGGGGHANAAGFSTDHLIFINKTDIQEPTICLNGMVSYREEFKRYIEEHSLTKNKGTKCFENVNKASRKEFNDYEFDVDYKARKDIPKIDLIVATTSTIKKPECFKHLYITTRDLLANKHGKVFLAIIKDDVDAYGKTIEIEDISAAQGGLLNISTLTHNVASSGGIIRFYDTKDPIKSIANEVSYII